MTAPLILKRAQEIEDAVVMLAVEQRAFGQLRAAKKMRKCGLTVSSGVRRDREDRHPMQRPPSGRDGP